MPKFFVDATAIKENKVSLTGDNFKHIKTVLRLTTGDKIIINDRQGNDYKCIIQTVGEDTVFATIEERQLIEVEPSVQTFLFQSLIKGEKMDWVIQKAVEIGVTEIIPIATTRCVVKLENHKKIQTKVDRWSKIAEGAAKQSGRSVIPKIHTPLPFKEAIAYAEKNGLESLIPYEKESEMILKKFLQQPSVFKYGIFIGPEGGFTEEEILYAKEHGVQPLTLGKRILRSETASLVTLATIMYEKGEME